MSLTNRRLSDKAEAMTGGKPFDFSGKVHGLHGRRRQGPLRIAGYALLLALGLYVGSLAIQGQRESSSAQSGSGQRPSGRRVLRDGTVATDTLVVYIFSNTDPEYIENLRFFAQFGMQQGDGCDYVVVVQEDGKELPALPQLPPNARYLRHPNQCYDWGTIGWVFAMGQADPQQYKYFIFMNSSVRGPFIPPYAKNSTRWQDLLINKLSDRVKLVGPTISCEGSPYQGNVKGEWRANPHVQSYVLATDQVGFKVWQKDENVFKCWESMWDVIWHGELGSSLAMLNAGYNLDSFMMRYQGVDWLNHDNWACNKQHNPYGEYYYDGISLNPFEVLFVKMKEKALRNEWPFSIQAAKYTKWMRQQEGGGPEILSNEYREDMERFRRPKKAYMQLRGPDCFDADYYLAENPDLKVHKTKEELWGHFLRAGAFEGRNYRFTCEAQI